MQAAAPFSLPAPVTAIDTVAASPEAMPHAPPTLVATTFVRNGKVRAVPLTVVSVTTGAVLSTVIACAPLVPTLLALSDCVAVTEYTPSVENAVVGVKVHALAVQVVVPFCVLAPVIATDTVGFTPAAVVHAPPTLRHRHVRRVREGAGVPLTDVSVTTGAVVWIVITLAPLVPVLAAVSVCVVVTLYVPLVDSDGENV